MDKETVYKKLNELGLERIAYTERTVYKLNIVDELTNVDYPLILTTHSYDQNDILVRFEEAAFGNGGIVPRSIRIAALSKLFELEQMFSSASSQAPPESATNGSMAPNEQEIKKLGNEMKNMKTNTELMDEGIIPDPIQY
ncbi:MAG: hypothetical protein K0Q59_2140 [Paenibacillus sp.]|nr:hypothetical protein [Paenibacillus sp.]